MVKYQTKKQSAVVVGKSLVSYRMFVTLRTMGWMKLMRHSEKYIHVTQLLTNQSALMQIVMATRMKDIKMRMKIPPWY